GHAREEERSRQLRPRRLVSGRRGALRRMAFPVYRLDLRIPATGCQSTDALQAGLRPAVVRSTAGSGPAAAARDPAWASGAGDPAARVPEAWAVVGVGCG